MSGMSVHGAEDVRQAWGRVTSWLERHAPDVFAALGGPGNPDAVSGAEERMGVELPQEMRQWLLANDLDAGRQPDAGSSLVSLGCEGVVPDDGLLLGLTDIERVHLARTSVEETQPSGDPEYPYWRREWVPIVAERDGFYGKFLNTRTGGIGSWSEGSDPEEGVHASLSAFFQDVADRLEGVPSGRAGGMREHSPQDEAVRRWARSNGCLVNARGRVPASLREEYEASR